MKILSQRDPCWANFLLGKSGNTIGKYGCLITCLSMLSDWYGKYFIPSWLAKKLSFTIGGLLNWGSMDSSQLPFKFVWRYYLQNDKKIKEILYSKDNACVLQVNNAHWVVLIGYSRAFGYRVVDPFYGDTIFLAKRKYKITGFTEITRK
jgi:ABC-type bacteriocin/lantibiotic exporter with double-glycine peptidase domain